MENEKCECCGCQPVVCKCECCENNEEENFDPDWVDRLWGDQ